MTITKNTQNKKQFKKKTDKTREIKDKKINKNKIKIIIVVIIIFILAVLLFYYIFKYILVDKKSYKDFIKHCNKLNDYFIEINHNITKDIEETTKTEFDKIINPVGKYQIQLSHFDKSLESLSKQLFGVSSISQFRNNGNKCTEKQNNNQEKLINIRNNNNRNDQIPTLRNQAITNVNYQINENRQQRSDKVNISIKVDEAINYLIDKINEENKKRNDNNGQLVDSRNNVNNYLYYYKLMWLLEVIKEFKNSIITSNLYKYNNEGRIVIDLSKIEINFVERNEYRSPINYNNCDYRRYLEYISKKCLFNNCCHNIPIYTHISDCSSNSPISYNNQFLANALSEKQIKEEDYATGYITAVQSIDEKTVEIDKKQLDKLLYNVMNLYDLFKRIFVNSEIEDRKIVIYNEYNHQLEYLLTINNYNSFSIYKFFPCIDNLYYNYKRYNIYTLNNLLLMTDFVAIKNNIIESNNWNSLLLTSKYQGNHNSNNNDNFEDVTNRECLENDTINGCNEVILLNHNWLNSNIINFIQRRINNIKIKLSIMRLFYQLPQNSSYYKFIYSLDLRIHNNYQILIKIVNYIVALIINNDFNNFYEQNNAQCEDTNDNDIVDEYNFLEEIIKIKELNFNDIQTCDIFSDIIINFWFLYSLLLGGENNQDVKITRSVVTNNQVNITAIPFEELVITYMNNIESNCYSNNYQYLLLSLFSTYEKLINNTNNYFSHNIYLKFYEQYFKNNVYINDIYRNRIITTDYHKFENTYNEHSTIINILFKNHCLDLHNNSNFYYIIIDTINNLYNDINRNEIDSIISTFFSSMMQYYRYNGSEYSPFNLQFFDSTSNGENGGNAQISDELKKYAIVNLSDKCELATNFQINVNELEKKLLELKNLFIDIDVNNCNFNINDNWIKIIKLINIIDDYGVYLYQYCNNNLPNVDDDETLNFIHGIMCLLTSKKLILQKLTPVLITDDQNNEKKEYSLLDIFKYIYVYCLIQLKEFEKHDTEDMRTYLDNANKAIMSLINDNIDLRIVFSNDESICIFNNDNKNENNTLKLNYNIVNKILYIIKNEYYKSDKLELHMTEMYYNISIFINFIINNIAINILNTSELSVFTYRNKKFINKHKKDNTESKEQYDFVTENSLHISDVVDISTIHKIYNNTFYISALLIGINNILFLFRQKII